MFRTFALSLSLIAIATTSSGSAQQARVAFHLEDATIAQIQQAIVTGQITTVGLVELYLKRIKAYNGTCVSEPQGILGPITTIPNAGQLNALGFMGYLGERLAGRRGRRRRRSGHVRTTRPD